MIVIGGLIFGAIGGGWAARQRGGKAADIAQWSAAFAILFGLLGCSPRLALTVCCWADRT